MGILENSAREKQLGIGDPSSAIKQSGLGVRNARSIEQPSHTAGIPAGVNIATQSIGGGLDNLPNLGVRAGNPSIGARPAADAGTIAGLSAAKQPSPPSSLNAENVALNDPRGGYGVRRIGDTYTNDPDQKGGVALGANQKPGVVTGGIGGLSTYSNPETEGMSPAQAAQYWNGISAEIDAKNERESQQLALTRNQVDSSDSIGTILAKRGNTQGLLKQLGVQAEVDVARDKASSAEALANIQEARRDERQQRNLEAQDSRLFAQLDSRERMQAAKDETAAKTVTPAQFSNNQEILLARKRLSGVSADDIKAKTQQYLANGRENPNYDPTLTATWRAANQRLVGDDKSFDEFSQKLSKQPTTSNLAPTKKQAIPDRFKADAAMRDYSLGTVTPRGYEVKDAEGNLVGYYQ